jgi:hypothetical protein
MRVARPVFAQPELPSTALDALATVEAALVTLGGMVRQSAGDGGLDLDEADLGLIEAMQCQDEAHYHLLASLGAVPVAIAFAFQPRATADRPAALAALRGLKEIALGGQMALARGLAGSDDPSLAETLFAMGTVEGGHEALLRSRLGDEPAAGRAFLRWRFADPLDVLPALEEAGLLDDSADAVPYPGPLERRCAGIFGLVPETTEDERRWDEAIGGG